MSAATAAYPNYPAGTILRVRGYERGHKLPARLAVVVAEAGGDAGERASVWFYGQGAPEIGTTVQPLYMDSEYAETGRDMLALDVRTLAKWERQLGPCAGYLHAFGWKVHNSRVRLQHAAA